MLHPVDKTPVQSWTFEEEDVVRIGRSVNNDVILYSAVVSRHHVELRRTEDGWEIQNIGSNGTYLAGQRIESQPVKDGLVIRLARSGPNIQINLANQATEVSSIHQLIARQKAQ
ncbi:MAG: FHA domain-containing protein [Cyanobacteria bacterium P01_D01_bin.105]